MTADGPRFLDEEDATPAWPAPPPRDEAPSSASELPRGPVLLDPEPDAPTTLETHWQPEPVKLPRTVAGGGAWAAAGVVILLVSWALLSCVSLVLELVGRSHVLGGAAILAVSLGLSLIAYAIITEWRSFQGLQQADALRRMLAQGDQQFEAAREVALAWVGRTPGLESERASVVQALRTAATPGEFHFILRSRAAGPLRAAALQLGRRAALEGGGLIAISPHASWDGIIAGLRALAVIRQVARLYGLRPGSAVTFVLLRKVAWTAVGVTGLDLLSTSLADHALHSVPIIKHASGVLPGGAAAMRLYRLAGITAEACCPVAT